MLFMPTVCPKEWNSGSAIRKACCSGGMVELRTSPLLWMAFITMLSWLSSAPLGCPVVPEV